VAQVFELAELVGRRPVGNIRRLPDGQYRLRYRRHGAMRTAPEIYFTRWAAQTALWAMGTDGRADYDHDRRYRALVLLATFASLRWGEATALRRCDLDLAAGIVRVRAAYAERSTGELVLGPPKSRAARRIVGIPASIVPALREHLSLFVGPEAEALIFPGVKGRTAAAQQLQQDVGLATRHPRDQCRRPALSRSPAHREPLRGRQRREPEGSDGQDGPRQRTRRDHLSARGPWG
jgi:integrase